MIRKEIFLAPDHVVATSVYCTVQEGPVDILSTTSHLWGLAVERLD